jgi:glycosyltransferase involved in cell wall biosynthesis
MATTPRVSIIIPTYNRSQLLLRALEAFRHELLPADEFEVIISDDGSSDGTDALVSSFSADYRVKYHYQEDRGFRAAAARNAGAALADGEILVFFDAGGLPSPSFAASHLATHSKYPKLCTAVIGPVYGYTTHSIGDAALPAEQAKGLSAQQIFDFMPKKSDARHETFTGIDFDLRRLPLPPMLFWTSNCSVRRDDFCSVGGFDDGFEEWGIEDTDLGYKLMDHGATFALCEEGWAIELPQPRDVAANLRAQARNIEWYLQGSRHVTPSREMLALLLELGFDIFYDIQGHYRALQEWEAQAKNINVLAEVQEHLQASPPDSRIAILGAGDLSLDSRPDSILFDFDRQLCERGQRHGHAVRHRIGLRTGLASNSIDSMLITSRMRGIWARMGDPIMSEARRVAKRVTIAWS